MSEPDLPPTLGRLGRELDSAYAREEARARVRARRRIAVILAVAIIGTPTAIATRTLWDQDGEGHRARQALILARSDEPGERWRLSSFRSGEDLCLRFRVLDVALSPVERCARTWSGNRAEYIIVNPGRGYVAGRVGETVRSVTVSAGQQTTTVRTTDPAGPEALTEQGGKGFRVFVAVLDRPIPSSARVRIR